MGLERGANLFWFHRRCHHAMDLIGSDVRSPEIPVALVADLSDSSLYDEALLISQVYRLIPRKREK
jgi:hypothetical protein